MKLSIFIVSIVASLALGFTDDMRDGTPICEGLSGWELAECFSMKACDYMNDLRRERGRTPMVQATEPMLKNALSHCEAMAGRRGLFHQKMGFPTGSGTCKSTVWSENVAMFGMRKSNPAAQCIYQWKYSEGHMTNMMRPNSKMCAVGVWQNPADNSWWCTQTFSTGSPDESCRIGNKSKGDEPKDETADDKKPEDKKSEDKKPMDKKPMDKKPMDKKSEDKKPEDKKPEDKKPEDKKPVDKKPVDKRPQNKKPKDNKPKDEKKRRVRCKRKTVLESRGRRKLVLRCRLSGNRCWCKFCSKLGRYRFCFHPRYLKAEKNFLFK